MASSRLFGQLLETGETKRKARGQQRLLLGEDGFQYLEDQRFAGCTERIPVQLLTQNPVRLASCQMTHPMASTGDGA
jgi:hypothetical protein